MKIKLTVLAAFFAAQVSAQTNITLDGWPDMDKEAALYADQVASELDIAVEARMNDWGAHHDKIKTNLATGSGAADVVAIDFEQAGTFINGGGFVNLSEKFNADQYKDLFPSYLWEQGRGLDGNMYALPYNAGPGVTYLWVDHLVRAGTTQEAVLKDWDSLIEYGLTLKEKGIPLVADASIIAQTIVNTEVAPGNSTYFDADDNIIVTNERFVRALTYAKQVRDLGLDARIGSWSGEWFEALNQGTYAVEFSGAWLGGFMERWIAPDAAGKWRVNYLPAKNYGSWGGTVMAIPEQSDNQDAAWEYIQHILLSSEHQIARFVGTGGFPTLTESYSDPSFDEPMPYWGGQKARQLWADVAQNVTAVPPNKGDAVARDIFFQAMSKVLNDGADIEESLAEAERLIQRRVRAL